MKNLKIAKLNENQNLIFTVFLLLLSFFINRNINKKNKLILLLLGLIVCIYKPLLVIPFTVFLITLFYSCKKKKVVEGFDSNDLYVLISNNLNDNINYDTNKIYFDKNLNSFVEFNKLLEGKQGETNYRKVKDKYDLYVEFFDIYFFDPNEENDWKLINKILDNTNKTEFQEIIDDIVISEENSSIDNYLKDENINDKDDYILCKNLGLFFYREGGKDYIINNKIINLIKFMGLQKIYFGDYKDNVIEDRENYASDEFYNKVIEDDKVLNNQYEILQKSIFELGILNYKNIIKTDYFSNVSQKTIDFKPYLLFQDINKLDKSYFSNILKNLSDYKLVRNPKREEGKISNLVDEDSSYGIFYTKKNNNYNKIIIDENYEDLGVEKTLDKLSTDLENNIEELELLDTNFYSNINNKIAYNYLLLLYVMYNGFTLSNFKEPIKYFFKENEDTNFSSIYEEKEEKLKNQIEQEKLTENKYGFTSIQDLLYDNIFFYIQNNHSEEYKESVKKEISKVYPLNYHLEEEEKEVNISPSPSGETVITDEQQLTYQQEIAKQFENTQLTSTKQQNLDLWYESIDSQTKIEGIKELNKLAENRNIELLNKNKSFNHKVEQFSDDIIGTVGDISKLFKSYFVEEFASNSPSPSQSMSYFEKYIEFVKELINILLKEDRALSSGMILVIVAIFIYFIDGGNKSNCSCNQKPNLLQFLGVK